MVRAEVVVSRCARTDRPYGLRVEERPGEWVVTWAFRMSPVSASATERAESEVITGPFVFAGSYPGCPHCGHTDVMQCGTCAKITCLADGTPGKPCRCAWCGVEGQLGEGSIGQLAAHGDS